MNSNLINQPLTPSGWVGKDTHFEYTILNSSILQSSVIDCIFNANTKELKDVILKAQISGFEVNSGSFKIFCWGEKPTVEIPCEIVIRGGY